MRKHILYQYLQIWRQEIVVKYSKYLLYFFSLALRAAQDPFKVFNKYLLIGITSHLSASKS